MADRSAVVIYTDGGADPNPGPGGWGAVLVAGLHVKEISGAEPATTNNRMEITAAIAGLRLLKKPCRVEVYTDSQYLRNGITKWIDAWQAQGWRKRTGAAVENVDLWQQLLAEVGRHEVEWHWVRGHRGNPLNERADTLATEAREALRRSDARPRPPSSAPPAKHPARPPALDARVGMPEVSLYARACALGVPGPAGYAALLAWADGTTRTVSGRWPSATNNVMELWAVVAGLRALTAPSRVTVYSASEYVLKGATHWLADWEANGWRTRKGQPVKNREVWQELSRVMGDHDLTFRDLAEVPDSAAAGAILGLAREEAERARLE